MFFRIWGLYNPLEEYLTFKGINCVLCIYIKMGGDITDEPLQHSPYAVIGAYNSKKEF